MSFRPEDLARWARNTLRYLEVLRSVYADLGLTTKLLEAELLMDILRRVCTSK